MPAHQRINPDLYRIDLACVVSNYIGETEKNLTRVSAAAEQSDVMLFRDEAATLFGSRSDVRDAHERSVGCPGLLSVRGMPVSRVAGGRADIFEMASVLYVTSPCRALLLQRLV